MEGRVNRDSLTSTHNEQGKPVCTLSGGQVMGRLPLAST